MSIIFKNEQAVSVYNPGAKAHIKGTIINNAENKSVQELGVQFFYHVKGTDSPVLMLAVLTPRGLCVLDIKRYPTMDDISEDGNAILSKLGDERNERTNAFRNGTDARSTKAYRDRGLAKFTAEDHANAKKYGAILDTPRAAAALSRDEMFRARKLMSLQTAAA